MFPRVGGGGYYLLVYALNAMVRIAHNQFEKTTSSLLGLLMLVKKEGIDASSLKQY